MHTLGVVITYREVELCEKAIKSLVNAGTDVALVFNGWNDKYRSWLDKVGGYLDHIFLNRTNVGFCKGNNQAMKIAIKNKYDYVFLLNNDAWVEQDCIYELEKALNKNPEVGLVQPKVYKAWNKKLLDTTGHIFAYGNRYSWEKGLGFLKDRGELELDEGQYDNLTNILSCCGCAAMYRVEMLRNVGLFWERLWSVCEDVELAWRAYENCWGAMFVPEAIAYHWRGYTSLKENNSLSRFWLNLFYRNWTLTLRRHASDKQKKFELFRLLLLGLVCKVSNILKITKSDGDYIINCALAIENDRYLCKIEKLSF